MNATIKQVSKLLGGLVVGSVRVSSCFQVTSVLIDAKSIQQDKEENNTKQTSYEVEFIYNRLNRTQALDVNFSHNKKYLHSSIMIPFISYGIECTFIAL